MKKSIIIIAFALISMTGIMKAEDSDSRDKLQIGAKIGLNVSNIYDTKNDKFIAGDEFSASAKTGIVLGGFINFPIGKFIGIQPELLFSQKGFKATGKVLGFSYEYTHTTSWIDIPIMFAFKPSEYVTFLAGPQYSFLLKKNYDFDNNAVPNLEQEYKDQNLRENTLCFLGGADIMMENFVLGIRAGWDLYDNNGDGTDTSPRYKNVWYQFTLGYKISL